MAARRTRGSQLGFSLRKAASSGPPCSASRPFESEPSIEETARVRPWFQTTSASRISPVSGFERLGPIA
jgi:hypothetical protein